jgi:hypothetical protein
MEKATLAYASSFAFIMAETSLACPRENEEPIGSLRLAPRREKRSRLSFLKDSTKASLPHSSGCQGSYGEEPPLFVFRNSFSLCTLFPLIS